MMGQLLLLSHLRTASVHNWDEHCSPILHDRGRGLTALAIFITQQPWFCIPHTLCWAYIMFAHTTTQGSQHEEQRVQKRLLPIPEANLLQGTLSECLLEGASAKQIIWRGAGHYATQDRSLHICGYLYTRHLFCSLCSLFYLQKVWGRWSMCCTSSAGLLGRVVTLSVNLTSDPGWAPPQKPFGFYVASGFVVSSFLNSWSRAAVVWGGTDAELSQFESKYLPGTVCQGVEPLPVEWEEKPICGPDKGKLKSWGPGLGRKLFGREADLILWGNQKPAG